MPDKKKFELSPSISILLAGVIIAAAIIFVNMRPAALAADVAGANQPAVNAHVSAPSAADHIIGSPSAPIVLIEYSDFQCPFCSLVYPTIKKIVDASNGHIAWVMRSLPLESIHPQAKPAALAAECVADQLGNAGFWKFADTIFANQSKISADYYAQVAAQLGADAAKFSSCVSTQKFAAKIDAESQEAQANGGQGTPYTIVYGYGQQAPVSGALPEASFMSVINAVKARQ